MAATIDQTRDYMSHPDFRALGNRVRYLRTQKGLAQHEIGCGPTVSKLEQGRA